MRLFEFVKTGNSSPTNFYQSTVEFANICKTSGEYDSDDAYEYEFVAEGFLKGIEEGARRFHTLSAFHADNLIAHWSGDGLDYRIIENLRGKITPYEEEDTSPELEPVQTTLDEWKSKIEVLCKDIDIRIFKHGPLFYAYSKKGEIFYGQFNPSEGRGLIPKF